MSYLLPHLPFLSAPWRFQSTGSACLRVHLQQTWSQNWAGKVHDARLGAHTQAVQTRLMSYYGCSFHRQPSCLWKRHLFWTWAEAFRPVLFLETSTLRLSSSVLVLLQWELLDQELELGQCLVASSLATPGKFWRKEHLTTMKNNPRITIQMKDNFCFPTASWHDVYKRLFM